MNVQRPSPRGSTRLAYAFSVATALGSLGCGGGQPIGERGVSGAVRVLAGAAHHILLTRDSAETVAIRVDADGRILEETRLPPESWATLQLGHRMMIDQVAGRARGRAPGQAESAWSWPKVGKALAIAVAGLDVVGVDDSARLCLLHDTTGVERDCVVLPDASLRPIGVGRIHGRAWVWLRGPGGVQAIAMRDAASEHDDAGQFGVQWSTALAADRPSPALVGDALWLEPADGVVELRDGRTGALRASELRPRLGTVSAAGGTVFLVGERDDGPHFVASLDAQHATLRWATPWHGATLTPDVSRGPGVIRARSGGSEYVFRASDGVALGVIDNVDSGGDASDGNASGGAATWVGSAANEESWLGLQAGNPRSIRLLPTAVKVLAAPPARPAWLRRGTVLHYLVVRPGQPPRRLSWTIEQVQDGAVRLSFMATSDAPPRTQLWDAGVLTGARELCVEPRAETPGRGVCPMTLVGREPMAQLRAGKGVSLSWPGSGPRMARLVGASLHAAVFRNGDENVTHLRHLPSWRVREAGGEARLEIAAWPSLPLVLQAERAGETLMLVAISVPAPEAPAAAAARAKP